MEAPDDLTRDALLAAHAERQHGLLTSRELGAAGVGPRLITKWVDSGRLRIQAHGVYRIGGCPLTTEASILAAVLVHGAGAWASFRTAGWLWEVEGLGIPGRIEITRLQGTSNERASAIVHRTTRMPRDHHTVLRGIPTTSLPRTVFDLAGSFGEQRLGRTIEAALRTRWCTIGALYAVTEELGGRGRPGTTAMRSMLDQRGRDYIPTESELDRLARAVVASIPGLDWQVPFSDERGYIRRVDGHHRAAGIVVEWDGAEFHDSRERQELDAAGDARLSALGLAVVRYRWTDVTTRPGEVRRELRNLIAERAPIAQPAPAA